MLSEVNYFVQHCYLSLVKRMILLQKRRRLMSQLRMLFLKKTRYILRIMDCCTQDCESGLLLRFLPRYSVHGLNQLLS